MSAPVSALAVSLQRRRAKGKRYQGKPLRHDCSRYDQMKKLRRNNPRIPSQAIIRKELVQQLLALPDKALRTYLARARFANGSTGKTFPRPHVLLRALGWCRPYSCWFCGGLLQTLTRPQRQKRAAQQAERQLMLREWDSILTNRGLLRHIVLTNRFEDGTVVEFPGKQLLLPSGLHHSIPKNARAGTFFTIPDVIFTSGAAAIWGRKRHGFVPVSEWAMKLLIAMLSETNKNRYGGVNPALLHLDPEGEPSYGLSLAALDRATLSLATAELMRRQFVILKQAVVSALDGHLIRLDDSARYPDERSVRIFRVATTGIWA